MYDVHRTDFVLVILIDMFIICGCRPPPLARHEFELFAEGLKNMNGFINQFTVNNLIYASP